MGKRKLVHVSEVDVEEKDETVMGSEGGTSEEESSAGVKVIGEIMKKAGGGKGKADRKYYQAFEVDGNHYEIDDAVLVTPERNSQKPYVAIVKEIKQVKDGSVHVTGQWFYRPEEAEKKGGGTWESSDSRELFYSFHIDEVPAESVMHKCQVYFIQPNKQLPLRSEYPGFIVRRVYDACEKKHFNLTDKDYEDFMQKEIDRLVEKTRQALGDLPDTDGGENMAQADEEASPDVNVKRRLPARRTIAPLQIKTEGLSFNEPKSHGETPTGKVDPSKVETPTSCVGTDEEVAMLLKTHGVLVGVHARDRWLQKLMQTIRELCGGGKVFPVKNNVDEGVKKVEGVVEENRGRKQGTEKARSFLGEGDLAWPKVALAAVQVVSSLEHLGHDSLGSDLHKYNLKMRQLDFNIKSNEILACRLLSKELQPATVINMAPIELKDGYLAAEKNNQEPPEQESMQMADVRCSICMEREVGVVDIIHVSYGDRYQLECLKCGHTWYSSRDAISSLVIKTVDAPSVGIAPWATSKFEEVEKDLSSPLPAQVEQVPADAVSGNEASTDTKAHTVSPSSHYEDVENTLTEKLSVANPVVKEYVNINPEEPDADMTPPVVQSDSSIRSSNSVNKHIIPPEIQTVSKAKLVGSPPNVLDHSPSEMQTGSKPKLVIPTPHVLENSPPEENISKVSKAPAINERLHPPLRHQESTEATIQSVPTYGEEEAVSGHVKAGTLQAESSDILP